MRKLLVIPLVLLFASFTGCNSNHVEKPDLTQGFSCNVSINYDDSDYSAVIGRIGQGVWTADFTAPETVNGMKLSYQNGEVSVKYKGFSVSLPNSSVPMKAIVSQMFEAVDSIANDPDCIATGTENGTVVEGETDAGSYIIAFDTEGKLISVNIPSQKLTLTVESYN